MNPLSLLLPALLAFSLLLTSCGGDATSPPDTDDTSTDSTAPGEKDPFYPLVTASMWEYDGLKNSLHVLGDSMVNGQNFTVLSFSGEPEFYVRREGEVYFGVDPETGTDSVILREGNVGTSWVIDHHDDRWGEDQRFEYKVVGRSDRHSVNGNIYADILHVRVDHLINESLYAWDDVFYARGIGLIERGHYDLDYEEPLHVVKLRSFHVPGSSASVEPAHREGGQAKFDGVLWKTSDADYYERGAIDEYIHFTMRGSANGTLYEIQVKMARIDVGVYSLDSDSTIATLARLFGMKFAHKEGEIEILYKTPSEIEGTFWIEFENGTMITDGTFRIPREM